LEKIGIIDRLISEHEDSLNEFESIPTSISHKKLNEMLVSAYKESNEFTNGISLEKEEFKKLVHNWTQCSKEVIHSLSNNKETLGEGKEANSLMALGAMEVHITLALQALKASKIEE
tara:strand:- start:138 stop:488 length:351 start_codon:yes stop_codon:yes gene_type:complete